MSEPIDLKKLSHTSGFSEKDLMVYLKHFRSFTKGKDFLNPYEFRESLGLLGVLSDNAFIDLLFNVFNKKRNNQVSFEEYIDGLRILTRGTQDEKLTFSFGMMDIGGVGYITIKEFKLVMESTQRILNDVDDIIGNGSGSVEVNPDTIEKLFHEMDSDNNGKVTLEEFKRCFRNSNSVTKWMSHIGSDRGLNGKKDLTTHLPFYVHRHLTIVSKQSADVLTTLSEMLQSMNALRSRGSGPISPQDLNELSDYLNHAVCKQFDTLTVIRKFMTTLEHEALGRSREFEQTHALPKTIRTSLMEQNEMMTNQLIDATRQLSVTQSRTQANAQPSRSSDQLKEQVAQVLPPSLISTVEDALKHHSAEAILDSSDSDEEEEGMMEAGEETLQNMHQPQKVNDNKGLAVHFTHESWNMVLNIMMGIRYAIGRVMMEPDRPLCSNDYTMKEKMTIVPHKLSSVTSGGSSCRFVDYAPMVFRKLREVWGIPAEEYMSSIGPQQILRNILLGSLTTLSELYSEGKSGSFFYYSADGKYMVKTISHTEHRFFRQILEQYYSHIVTNPDTMLVRFLGAHQIRFGKHNKLGGKRIYFVVMGNLFDTPFKIQRRYDLKGSWVGRFTPDEKRVDITRALKDLDIVDLNEHIRMTAADTALFNNQLEKDSQFLANCGIIDYSLLLGLHYVEGDLPPEPEPIYGRYVPFWQKNWGGLLSDDKKVIYYMGVIDILIHFNSRKFGELAIKTVFMDGKGVSVQYPKKYQKRFMKFMDQLSDPKVKEIKLGKGVPKKYLEARAAKEEKESS